MGHLVYDKGGKNTYRRKEVSSISRAGKTGQNEIKTLPFKKKPRKTPRTQKRAHESSVTFLSSHASPGTRAPAPGLGCCPRHWRPLSSCFHRASLKPAHPSPQHLLRTEASWSGHGEPAPATETPASVSPLRELTVRVSGFVESVSCLYSSRYYGLTKYSLLSS